MQNTKQIILILIISSMFMLAGCGSTTGVITTNTTNLQIPQSRKFEPIPIKTLYSKTLKTLVKSKTITKIQSGKVFAALTTNMPKITHNKNLIINKPSYTTLNNNQITSLVTSGVITQAQADKIIAKISQAITINRSKQII